MDAAARYWKTIKFAATASIGIRQQRQRQQHPASNANAVVLIVVTRRDVPDIRFRFRPNGTKYRISQPDSAWSSSAVSSPS